MTGIVIKDKPVDVGVPVKGGDGYSRCPNDGCVEVERQFKSGGKSPKGENYLEWEMYNADRKRGGCGTTWAADTKQGVERAAQSGRKPPRWITESAATGRSYSMPSEQFSDNYERIFGHS